MMTSRMTSSVHPIAKTGRQASNASQIMTMLMEAG